MKRIIAILMLTASTGTLFAQSSATYLKLRVVDSLRLGDRNIREFSTDPTFRDSSDNILPTQSAVKAALDNFAPLSQKGVPNGIASLDGGGKLLPSQFPESPTTIVTTSTFLDNSYHTVLCNGTGCGGPTGSAITLTLPVATGITGRRYTVKRINSGCVTIQSAGGNIEGATTYTMSGLPGSDFATFVSDGTNWKVISKSYVLPTVPPTPSLNDVMAIGNKTAYGFQIQGASNLTYTAPALSLYKSTAGVGTIMMNEDGGTNSAFLSLQDTASINGQSAVVIGANDNTYGGGSLTIQGGGRFGGARPVGIFNGGVRAGNLALGATIISANYTTTTNDYTIINKSNSGNPIITLTGEPGTVYVLVEEAANPTADGMVWTPAITYQGAMYTNANNPALSNYSRFIVQNVGGVWYLIGAN